MARGSELAARPSIKPSQTLSIRVDKPLDLLQSMTRNALIRVAFLLQSCLVARVELLRQCCRRGRTRGSNLHNETAPIPPYSGTRGRLDSLLDNEAAMTSYASEVNLDRIRNLSSEDRQALVRRRVSATSTQHKPTLPNLTPRRPHIERWI